MILPKNSEHRLAILRRLLAGSPIVYPVMVWANCGGDPADFNCTKQLALCDDLRSLGYERRKRAGRIPRCGHTMILWQREEEWPEDVFQRMPYFGPPLNED